MLKRVQTIFPLRVDLMKTFLEALSDQTFPALFCWVCIGLLIAGESPS